jgi:hypothetical protein
VTTQTDGAVAVGYFTPASWIVGSYTVERSRMRSEMRLIDTQTGATAWVGTARTDSDRKATAEGLISSLAAMTANELRDEQLLIPASDE